MLVKFCLNICGCNRFQRIFERKFEHFHLSIRIQSAKWEKTYILITELAIVFASIYFLFNVLKIYLVGSVHIDIVSNFEIL